MKRTGYENEDDSDLWRWVMDRVKVKMGDRWMMTMRGQRKSGKKVKNKGGKWKEEITKRCEEKERKKWRRTPQGKSVSKKFRYDEDDDDEDDEDEKQKQNKKYDKQKEAKTHENTQKIEKKLKTKMKME